MSGRTTEFRVGLGSCGIAAGAAELQAALSACVLDLRLDAQEKSVGCNGMCHCEPRLEVVEPSGRRILYANVPTQLVPRIARRHAAPTSLAARIRNVGRHLQDWRRRGRAQRPGGVPPRLDALILNDTTYLQRQQRIVLENCGVIDPLNIDEYLARDGYRALQRSIQQRSPAEIVALLSNSGLRGRGGAGFPTGRKWQLAASQPGPFKYVICNGDEGDPGAFMDRLVLEGDPHRVIEGLAIAAYAVGARRGFFYVRTEYPHALRCIRAALDQARQRGFIGQHVCGSDFSFDVDVREGAGAFVCGEETALIASLEGRRGTPRLRPPYPIERGLHDCPTVINNVETLACVPWIVRRGPEAFAAHGTGTSKGTKVFALAGRVRRGGLVEVPMGISIRSIVEDIGGGIRDGRTFKAVQIGGPSGGCLPASLADTPIDYEALGQTGAIMGSGGLVVLDDRSCMVDIARYLLRFTQAESCGKCTACRVGTKRMLEILDRICEGAARRDDLEKLEELADHVGRASLCGLGQTAPNPVLTTLRYFRDEYEAHAREHRCPAGRCAKLIRYQINERCIGCTLCAQACPVDAIAFRPYERHTIDESVCTRCDMCFQVCRDDAVEIV